MSILWVQKYQHALLLWTLNTGVHQAPKNYFPSTYILSSCTDPSPKKYTLLGYFNIDRRKETKKKKKRIDIIIEEEAEEWNTTICF